MLRSEPLRVLRAGVGGGGHRPSGPACGPAAADPSRPPRLLQPLPLLVLRWPDLVRAPLSRGVCVPLACPPVPPCFLGPLGVTPRTQPAPPALVGVCACGGSVPRRGRPLTLSVTSDALCKHISPENAGKKKIIRVLPPLSNF